MEHGWAGNAFPKETTTDYVKVQPKRFPARDERETAEGKYWKKLRFLEFEPQVGSAW